MNPCLRNEVILRKILSPLELRDLFKVQSLSLQWMLESRRVLEDRVNIVLIERPSNGSPFIPVDNKKTLHFFMDDNRLDKLDASYFKKISISFYGDDTFDFVNKVMSLTAKCVPRVTLSLTFSHRRHSLMYNWSRFMESGVNLISIKGKTVLFSQQVEQLVTRMPNLEDLSICLPNKTALRCLTSMDNLMWVTFFPRGTHEREHDFDVDVMALFLREQFGKKLRYCRLCINLSSFKKDLLESVIKEIASTHRLEVQYDFRQMYEHNHHLNENNNQAYGCSITITR